MNRAVNINIFFCYFHLLSFKNPSLTFTYFDLFLPIFLRSSTEKNFTFPHSIINGYRLAFNSIFPHILPQKTISGWLPLNPDYSMSLNVLHGCQLLRTYYFMLPEAGVHIDIVSSHLAFKVVYLFAEVWDVRAKREGLIALFAGVICHPYLLRTWIYEQGLPLA